MDRVILAVVIVAAAALPAGSAGWRWTYSVAPIVVGIVGFFLNLKADRRADREEERAIRAERRAEEAERREQEGHGWEKEKREAEQAEERERRRILEWVAKQKVAYGTKHFSVAPPDLEIARAARNLGLLNLKELGGGNGDEVVAAAWVI